MCANRTSPARSAPVAVTSVTVDEPRTASPSPCPAPPRHSADDIGTDTEYQDAHGDNHVCPTDNPDHTKQTKVGKFRNRITLHHRVYNSIHPNKESVKEKPHATTVQPHGHHHTKNVNHHQCCGAFGNPHVRHKTSNASCRLI